MNRRAYRKLNRPMVSPPAQTPVARALDAAVSPPPESLRLKHAYWRAVHSQAHRVPCSACSSAAPFSTASHVRQCQEGLRERVRYSRPLRMVEQVVEHPCGAGIRVVDHLSAVGLTG